MPGREWCYVRGGRRHGPVPTDELRRRAAAGEVGPDDLVWPADDPAGAGPAAAWKDLVPGAAVPDPSPSPAPGTTPAPATAGPRGPTDSGLVPCGRCGAGVSDRAEACPHCGERQPRAAQLAEDRDGGGCERCGVFNLLGKGAGGFPADPAARCRGCGAPLAEAYPAALLLSEMERVNANAAEVGRGVGRVAGVVAYVVFLAAVAGMSGWLIGLYVGFAAYAVTRRVVRGYVRRRAYRTGYGDPSPLADAMNAPGVRHRWEYVWDPTRNANAHRRAREWEKGFDRLLQNPAAAAAASPPARRWWDRLPAVKVAAVVGVVIAGCYVYRAEFSPYALGRKAGVAHVREMAAKGAFVRAGMTLAKALDLIPTDPNAGPDWNAGFRAGFQEELERMYPQARK